MHTTSPILIEEMLTHFRPLMSIGAKRREKRSRPASAVSVSKTGTMPKIFIGDAVCREFESEASAAEEMLDHLVCSREQFSVFRRALKGGDGSGTFRNWRQRVQDSWLLVP